MAAKRKKPKKKSMSRFLDHRIKEGLLLFTSACSLFMLVSLVSFHPQDPGFSHSGSTGSVMNLAGPIGAWVSDLLLWSFGYFAYALPIILTYLAWWSFHIRGGAEEEGSETSCWWEQLTSLKTLGSLLLFLSGCTLAGLFFHDWGTVRFDTGGVLGHTLGRMLIAVTHPVGAGLILWTTFLIGLTLSTGLSWVAFADFVGYWTCQLFPPQETDMSSYSESEEEEEESEVPKVFVRKEPALSFPPLEEARVIARKEPPPAMPLQANSFSRARHDGNLPDLDLLDLPSASGGQMVSSHYLEQLSRLIESNLKEFGIEVRVVGQYPGPVITRFELQLAAGTKVSKISGLSKDLARSLSVTSVRVVEVIPGKSVIGLEVPNPKREVVRLREVLSAACYQDMESVTVLALGKDIAGKPTVVDLSKMPHLLVAGTTGSGKSVGMNAMLLSMLYKATPEQLRLILIDPKMLELSIYEGIPHLLTPVVTDMRQAGNALRWCVAEMDRRYKLMAALGVRNVASYNAKIQTAEEAGQPIPNPLFKPEMMPPGFEPEPLQKLPIIVVLVDEFADMIMVVGKKVEELITRIAQKARASGIHLILATQRPSVDVITGLIKANVPARIAFQVSSKIDSRTILDQQGAEQLLGHGDMLYLAPGTGVPIRVHGAYVMDEEVHRVVADLKSRGSPQYLEEILETSGGEGEGGGEGRSGSESEQGEAEDPLYQEAVQIVMESRRASISNIQRRLKIGYNRAARLVDAMEAAGLVSGMDSNGSRQVLTAGVEE